MVRLSGPTRFPPDASPEFPPECPPEVCERLERGEITVTQALNLAAASRSDRRPASPPPGTVTLLTTARPSVVAAPRPAAAAVKEADGGDSARVDEVLAELNALIGLGQAKEIVREVRAYLEIQRRRAREGLLAEPMALHMVFSGNPGTGKTTVARLLARLFKELGVLQRGQLIEVERADLVGEYIGHTAQKTREQIKKALGGILFIDEAYSLGRGGEKDFGREAIDTLVRAMEEHRDNLVIILAGYQREMKTFMQLNPGLKSRFPIQLQFQDFTPDELMAIADQMLTRRQYRLSDEARQALGECLRAGAPTADENSGNARFIRNLVERSIRRQAVRLVAKAEAGREELILIERDDLRECAE